MIEFRLAAQTKLATGTMGLQRKSFMNKELTRSLFGSGLKFLLCPVSGMRFNLAQRNNSGIHRRRNRSFGLD